jgi:choline dehydrogenase-like flavoprotein
MSTEPLASLVDHATLPDDSAQSVEDWDKFCRSHAISVWHPVGSTSMAPREIGGVVNHKMIVYGTKNLRVVDAGSMPINVAAHTAATVYAMAEKVLFSQKLRYFIN